MNSLTTLSPTSTPQTKLDSSARMKPLNFGLVLKYLGDWILSLSCSIAGFYLETVQPYERYIIPDQTISYPFVVDEQIPPGWLPLIGTLIPSIIILLITLYLYISATFSCSSASYKGKFLSKYHWSQFLHHNILGLVMGVSACYVTTNIIKV